MKKTIKKLEKCKFCKKNKEVIHIKIFKTDKSLLPVCLECHDIIIGFLRHQGEHLKLQPK